MLTPNESLGDWPSQLDHVISFSHSHHKKGLNREVLGDKGQVHRLQYPLPPPPRLRRNWCSSAENMRARRSVLSHIRTLSTLLPLSATGVERSSFARTHFLAKIHLGRLFHVILQIIDTLEPFLSLQGRLARLQADPGGGALV